MTARPEAPSERELHKRMVEGDVVTHGVRGGATGAALGAALHHLGHGPKYMPLIGGAAGTALGTVIGYHKGRERKLKDTVQQERLHQRTEARVKKSYNEAVMAGFSAELVKHAGGPNFLTGIGTKVLRGGNWLAHKAPEWAGGGAGGALVNGMKSGVNAFGGGFGGTRRLATAAGGAAIAAPLLVGGGLLAGHLMSGDDRDRR